MAVRLAKTMNNCLEFINCIIMEQKWRILHQDVTNLSNYQFHFKSIQICFQSVSKQFQIYIQRSMQKLIEIYSTPFFGHAYPLCKITQFLLKKKQHRILFYTSKFMVKKLKKSFPEIQMVSIEDDLTEDIVHSNLWNVKPKAYVFDFLANIWKQHFKEKNTNPDLIISDYEMVIVMRYCKAHDIKLIVNYPEPLESLKYFNMPHFSRSIGIGGLTLIHPILYNTVAFVDLLQVFQEFKNHALVFLNSHIGFDFPAIIPSHLIMTGFLTKESDAEDDLGEQLNNWIEVQRKKNKKQIIYIAFGTIYYITEQFKNLIYETLLQLEYPVIWSLKSPMKRSIKEDQFFIREWLPQKGILKLEEVKIFISHCGFGSLAESIVFAKPLLLVPFAVDQPMNAEMVQKHEAGIMLWKPLIPFPKKQMNPKISSKELIQKVLELMKNPKYQRNISKISNISRTINTQRIINETVDNCLQVGYKHLIDKDFNKMTRRSSLHSIPWILIILVVIYYFWSRAL